MNSNSQIYVCNWIPQRRGAEKYLNRGYRAKISELV